MELDARVTAKETACDRRGRTGRETDNKSTTKLNQKMTFFIVSGKMNVVSTINMAFHIKFEKAGHLVCLT